LFLILMMDILTRMKEWFELFMELIILWCFLRRSHMINENINIRKYNKIYFISLSNFFYYELFLNYLIGNLSFVR
jgi:hypothetical protein